MNEIIAAIDMGSSKVTTIVGLLNDSNEIEVLGRGIEQCNGIKKGVIVDIENVWSSVVSSVKQAEAMSNISIKSAFINLPSSCADVYRNSATIQISDNNIGIRQGDLERLLNEAGKVDAASDWKTVDVVPRHFSVDDYTGIKDPVGMKGNNITVNADVILGKFVPIENVVRAMDMAKISVDGMIMQSLALAEVTLTPEEREFGVILVDIGGSVTEISVFKDNEILFDDFLNIGGENITKDISIGLKIPLYEAERLKREYEINVLSLFDDDQRIEVYDVSGEKKFVYVSEIAEIIDARASEIIKLSFDAFRNSGIKRSQISGVVLTGAGISYVDGVIETGKKIFDLPIRIPSYKGLDGIRPEFILPMGILRYVANNSKYSNNIKKSELEIKNKGKNTFFKKFKGFFTNQ